MWMRLIVFFIAFIRIFPGVDLQAQTVEETYEIGLEAYYTGNQELAQTHLERVAYFARDSIKASAHLVLGDIYREKGDFQRALNNYSLAQGYFTDNLEIRDELSALKVKLWITMRQYKLAYAETFRISDRLEISLDKLLFQAFSLYESGQYREAKEVYLKLVSTQNQIELISYFNKAHKISLRSDNNYLIASYLLPGLGQALNGRYLDALNSFVLVSSLAVVFIYTGASIGWLEGGVAIMPWLYRYYKGGAENAEKWSIQRKKQELRFIHYQILDLIELNNGR